MEKTNQSGMSSPEPASDEEVGKTVLVSFGKRSRPVSYAGGWLNEFGYSNEGGI